MPPYAIFIQATSAIWKTEGQLRWQSLSAIWMGTVRLFSTHPLQFLRDVLCKDCCKSNNAVPPSCAATGPSSVRRPNQDLSMFDNHNCCVHCIVCLANVQEWSGCPVIHNCDALCTTGLCRLPQRAQSKCNSLSTLLINYEIIITASSNIVRLVTKASKEFCSLGICSWKGWKVPSLAWIILRNSTRCAVSPCQESRGRCRSVRSQRRAHAEERHCLLSPRYALMMRARLQSG